jgi:hypothetical protein
MQCGARLVAGWGYQMPSPMRIILTVSHPNRPTAIIVSRLKEDAGFSFIVLLFMKISRFWKWVNQIVNFKSKDCAPRGKSVTG